MLRIEEVFAILNERRSRYLLIGGLASILYGVPRTTVDIDIAIDPAKENVQKTIAALETLGLVADTDKVEEILDQGGVSLTDDLSIDVLTRLPVGRFGEYWNRMKLVKYRGVTLKVISKQDQVALLRATGRKKDLEDADYLQEI